MIVSKKCPGFTYVFFALILMLLLATSCAQEDFSADIFGTKGENNTDQIKTTKAEIKFLVKIPLEKHDPEIPYYLETLDEVTGFSLNSKRIQLLKIDDQHYGVSVSQTTGIILKYRYVQGGNPAQYEHNSEGVQVEYRAYPVTGPDTVEDQVISWTPLPYSGLKGRIQGTVHDKDNQPVVNVLVTAAGNSSLTSADGSYLIENVPEGKHLITIFALDGYYQPFRQYAVVRDKLTTLADIQLAKAKLVNITFQVIVPEGGIPNTPMRIIGDLYQLGDTFTEASGESNILPSRAPLLMYSDDGLYSISLSLPSGYTLHYKYTLGDGFWNAQQDSDSSIMTRELTIPPEDTLISDNIYSWKSGNSGQIQFRVSVPQTTDSHDTLSIQFLSAHWSATIPMWPLGNNQWFYILYGPPENAGEIGYRYCRNDQCGSADDLATSQENSIKGSFTAGPTSQEFIDTISDWSWWQPQSNPTSVLASEPKEHRDNFITGVEFYPGYSPSWQPRLGYAFQNIRDIGAKWVFLTPSWTFTTTNPLQLEPVIGKDALWSDVLQANQWAHQDNLKTAIFPATLTSEKAYEEFWGNAKADPDWWNSWFDRYRTFLIHFASLAEQSGADALILGEPAVFPALPGGVMPDGSSSGAPENSNDRWQNMIAEIRQVYQGPIIWAMNYSFDPEKLPKFLTDIDQIYILFSAPLGEQENTSPQGYSETIRNVLSTQAMEIKEKYDKPIIIGLSYPSTGDSSQGCVTITGLCDKYDELFPNVNKTNGIQVDLNEQMEIYNGALLAINELEWIDGVVSRGYYPPVALHDPSISIHGKPAADVLWYWFPEFTK